MGDVNVKINSKINSKIKINSKVALAALGSLRSTSYKVNSYAFRTVPLRATSLSGAGSLVWPTACAVSKGG